MPDVREPLVKRIPGLLTTLEMDHNGYAPIHEFQLEHLSEVASKILSSLRKAESYLNEDPELPHRLGIPSLRDPRHRECTETISASRNVFERLQDYVQRMHLSATQDPSDAMVGQGLFDLLDQINSYVRVIV